MSTSFIEQFIGMVENERAAMALAGLTTPRAKTEFEYGALSGYIRGLTRALSILEQLQDAADGRPRPAPVTPSAISGNPYLDELNSAPKLPEQW